MIKTKDKIVKECFHQCPFFQTNMDGMYCGHPYFDDKGAYSNMIISQENSRNGKIPEECPLRKGQTEIILRVSLDGIIKSGGMKKEQEKTENK